MKSNLAAAPVHDIKEVAAQDYVKKIMVKGNLPDGRTEPLFPAPMETDYLNENNYTIKEAPGYGHDNDNIFKEAGLSEIEIVDLKEKGIV